MMMTELLLQCVSCLMASFFFGMMLGQKKSTLPLSALIGLNAYILFRLLDRGLSAYFLAALSVGILCEISARILKRTTTMFVISSIIPLVPGLGLYRCMMLLAKSEFALAAAEGSRALGGIGAIALGLTIATAMFSRFRRTPLPYSTD